MRVKVTHKFRDKYTGQIMDVGNVIDISKERYAEIMAAGNFVYAISQNDIESNNSETPNSLSGNAEETITNKSDNPDDGFEIMSVRELKEYADKAHKLTFKAGTKKAEIIETLRGMENGK